MNQKLDLEGKLENSNLEVSQLVPKIKVVQGVLENCDVEKKDDQEMLETVL